ncbi:MAG: carbon-nitrogen family hydrolase [Acidothermus cellulolyticus]|nr:carbon-nitrogen family hydrolase [Acidothermus cellulolyticus]
MRITILQLEVSDHEPWPDRVDRVVDLVASCRDADLVVLPELWVPGAFASRFFAEVATELPGPILPRLGAAAKKLGAFIMAGTFIERADPATDRIGYNTAVLLNPDGAIAHTYRKVHLFGFHEGEARMLAAGSDITTCRLEGGRMTETATYGTSTCYDLRFPELYRILVDQGCDLLVIPSGWPAQRLEHWRVLTRARAIENQLFVVACNETGHQQGVELAGHSVVVDPWGQVVAEAGAGEEILTVDIDLGEVPRIRREFPVLPDRRFRCVPAN